MPSLVAPDGTELAYDACEPDSGPAAARAAALVITGWSDHAGRWAHVGRRLAAAGIAAYLLDQRGHGRSGGRRGHLSRFSQLLGDLQAFRRVVRARVDRPQVVIGHSFGGLVALRYLETQPSDPVAATVLSSPFLALAFQPPPWKVTAGRALADLWPTFAVDDGIEPDHVSRDPAVNAAYATDPLVHHRITTGAWRELRWAQSAVLADGRRIECPTLFLLGGEDHLTDAHLAHAFAERLHPPAEVRWYPEMFHETLNDPQRDRVLVDLLAFVDRHVTAGPRSA